MSEHVEEVHAPEEPSVGGQGGGSPPSRGWAGRAAATVVVVGLVGLSFWLGSLTGGAGGGAGGDVGGRAPGGGEAEVWTCSMDPQIRSPEPGMCPICGMDLIPVEGVGGDESRDRVQLSPAAVAQSRIETAQVMPRAGGDADLRLLGRVDHDETQMRTVTAWTAGRIDRLRVATTGAQVKRGEAIATIYSPEIYAAHQDLIQARRQLSRLEEAMPVARTAAESTLRASRQRLSLLGVTEGELKGMEAAESPWRQVQIRSPFAGTVIERLASEGQYVEAGAGIYRLTDLGRLWVQLDAYEKDLPMLEIGQKVALTLEALPGEVFEGRVAFVDPVISARTRTARVRVEVDNEGGRLRPGMFAEAVVRGGEGGGEPQLVIPETAALFSGRRSLVYVEVPGQERPTYEAREVRLGVRSGGVYPVIAGLEYGERVVTRGAFRLDADLQIKGGRSLMTRPDDRTPASFDAAIVLSADERARLAPILRAYLDAQEALAADDFDRARAAAQAIQAAAQAAAPAGGPQVVGAWAPMQRGLITHARYFERAASIEVARAAFETLTAQVAGLMRVFGNPLDEALHLNFCPMAFDNRGAQWFQRGDTLQNAYFGAAMLQCGERREALGGGEFLSGELAQLADPDLTEGGAPASRPGSAPGSAPASKPGGGPGSAPESAPAGGQR